MKTPDFVFFKLDTFVSNLLRRKALVSGASAVGMWTLLRKAVSVTDTLTIDINDPFQRDTLELDCAATSDELTDLLNYASKCKMIDPELYDKGIIWVENLNLELARFFGTYKRDIPQRPGTFQNSSSTSGDITEKEGDVATSHARASKTLGLETPTRAHVRVRDGQGSEGESPESISLELPDQPAEEVPRSKQRPSPTAGTDGKWWTKPDGRNEPPPQEQDDAAEIAWLQTVARAAAEMVRAYGKEGKPAKVQQAMADAIRHVMSGNSVELGRMLSKTQEEAVQKIVAKAGLARQRHLQDNTERRFIPEPQTWLEQKSYLNNYDGGQAPQHNPKTRIDK